MDKKERYTREAQAKGGSVPPDMRRHSKARNQHPTKVEIQHMKLEEEARQATKRD